MELWQGLPALPLNEPDTRVSTLDRVRQCLLILSTDNRRGRVHLFLKSVEFAPHSGSEREQPSPRHPKLFHVHALPEKLRGRGSNAAAFPPQNHPPPPEIARPGASWELGFGRNAV